MVGLVKKKKKSFTYFVWFLQVLRVLKSSLTIDGSVHITLSYSTVSVLIAEKKY